MGILMKLHTIDVKFVVPKVIACFLIETASGPILIETGPDTTFENLKGELHKLDYSTSDIKHVFVTHIHLDHSGAAWHFAQEGATVYVHPRGARHLAEPSRLMASARMIYKERMDELWGRVEPIPEERIYATTDGESVKIGGVEITAVETPGHASHHNAYIIEDHAFLGDVGGICIEDGPPLPPTPPPDINVEAWQSSIKKLYDYNPGVLHPTHFAVINRGIREHFGDLELRLLEYTSWIGERLKEGKTEEDMLEDFDKLTREILDKAGVSADVMRSYELADPFWMNVGGLIRYWKKFRL